MQKEQEQPAAGFERTRFDHSRETAEDYVELILRLEAHQGDGVRNADLVKALGVAQPTVTKALDRLQVEGWVEFEPRQKIFLTASGRQLAESSLERHQLIVDFLEFIGVPPSQAQIDAEGIEHHVSDLTLTALKAYLRGAKSATNG